MMDIATITMTAWYLLAILNILDACTTWYVISRCGGQEKNPVMDALIRKFGLVPALCASKTVSLAVMYYLAMTTGHTVFLATIMLALCLFYTWVLWNNGQVIANHTEGKWWT